jgi:hypothetical protein
MRDETEVAETTGSRQQAWHRANTLTLIVVGVVWIGMIVHRLSLGEMPSFLIAMVPAFALIRFLAYLHYKLRSVSSP